MAGFRYAVEANYGELGLGTLAAGSRMIISFAETCGIFVIRVPSRLLSEAQVCVSLMQEISRKPVTVRVIGVCGKMKNAIQICIERILIWRNSVPIGISTARKPLLDATVRSAIIALNSLPSYV
jgi:RNase P/RNase MRP subunit POP5